MLCSLHDKEACAGSIDKVRTVLAMKERCIVLSAGGDGTFTWVIDLLRKSGVDVYSPYLVFSAIPFGTGNDLAQSFGWGRKVSKRVTRDAGLFYDLVKSYTRDGTIINHDLWEIRVCGGKCEDGGAMKRLMSNYLTIGLQGQVGASFEKKRGGTRFRNAVEYIKQVAGVVMKRDIQRVRDFFLGIVFPSRGCDTLEPTHSLPEQSTYQHGVELLVQNISGIWGRQVNLWKSCRLGKSIMSPASLVTNRTSSSGDGRLEVFTIVSRWDYFIKQFKFVRCGSKLGRMGQLGSFDILLKQGCSRVHFMIDGEFYTADSASCVSVVHAGKIKVLRNDR